MTCPVLAIGEDDLDLTPLAVGFDVRLHDLWVKLPSQEPLTVRYSTKAGEVRVVRGPRARVTATLRRHGYHVTAAVLS